MAARYWVGGAGTWSSGNTANWSDSSGGSGGFSVPSSADTVTFDANSGIGVVTFTNGGVTVGQIFVTSIDIELSLGAAFSSSSSVAINAGTFTTNNYSVTAVSLSSSTSTARTINLGSSTITLSSASAPISFAAGINLTFNAGTSLINCTGTSFAITGGAKTFYNVSFTSTAAAIKSIAGANTFNNLTVSAPSSAGLMQVFALEDQTINGTLTLSAGANATMRTFLRSSAIGTTRTFTCAAVASLTDIDFRDITIAGAAAPVSGTRLGDCKGNSGITFDAAKTVYWRGGTGNWSSNSGWSDTDSTSGGTTFFPLAQDTATFISSPASGATVTLNAAYNIGTIDMSARTSNTMTLATGTTTPAIYGNWINGTGTTLTGTGRITLAGRGSQTITSAGKTFTQPITFETPGGSVTLLDAFATSNTTQSTILTAGTFDANGYNVTLPNAPSAFASANNNTRTIAIGSGTWTIASSGTTAWSVGGTGVTVTGTGTINLTGASTKTFVGGGVQTYPTLNQGGAGTLTVTGSNKFAGLTNTAVGRIQFTGGTTNEFTSFGINGVAGNLLQLGSTNTTQAILKRPIAWNVGANSTDAGNNTGLSFTAGSNDYLSISYINGQIAASASTIYYGATNITNIRFGSAAVSAVYYGSTKVF